MGESKRRQDFYSQKPHQKLGDAPVEPEYHDKMVAVVGAIDQFFNGDKKGNDRKTGFVLLTFPFGNNDGRCNFMSNGADRADLVVLFKEMLARFQGQPETTSKTKQ